jgi:hypothetical protein
MKADLEMRQRQMRVRSRRRRRARILRATQIGNKVWREMGSAQRKRVER